MDEEKVMAEVMNLLEAEPAPAALPPALLPAADIPALREDLAILVSTGKCKEAIGLTKKTSSGMPKGTRPTLVQKQLKP